MADDVKVTKPAAPKLYSIEFHGEGGDIEIVHNYKLNLYKRNEKTTIDENFLGALKHAVIHTFAGGKELTIPQFQYTVEPL